MAFEKYKSGAWMEPETIVGKYVAGAWQACESAKRIISGAWAEVWANIKWLTKLSSSITVGTCYVAADGSSIEFVKIMDYAGGYYGTISGAGTIVLYLDGSWTNPTISFDYEGSFIRSSTAETGGTWYCASAGKISLYSRDTAGAEKTTTVIASVGQTKTVTPSSGDDIFSYEANDSYEGTLTGTYNRVGLSIYVNSYTGKYYMSSLRILVRNLRINGAKVGFPSSLAFDNQEWAE